MPKPAVPATKRHTFENELGVQAPVGFWDPAGFTADGSVENFKRRRQTELKHSGPVPRARVLGPTQEVDERRRNMAESPCSQQWATLLRSNSSHDGVEHAVIQQGMFIAQSTSWKIFAPINTFGSILKLGILRYRHCQLYYIITLDLAGKPTLRILFAIVFPYCLLDLVCVIPIVKICKTSSYLVPSFN